VSYHVHVSQKAKKEIRRLDRNVAFRVIEHLDKIAASPFDQRLSSPLEMSPHRRYSRVGDWRIVYEVNPSENIIEISAVQHRSNVYKKL
jgi:mRNA interferase RelE/StbE